MKKVILFIVIVLMVSSCIEPKEKSSEQKISDMTEKSMVEAGKQIGMPGIMNFQEKKLMKQIYELRDREDLICYAYIVDMHGKLHFIGKAVGYGLPYSTQFSNPQKLVDVTDYGIRSHQANDAAVIPQPEPNGLYMPDGLSATWLLMIDPETNKPRPVYLEPEILVSPFKMH